MTSVEELNENDDEIRFWPRLGMYVTEEFAHEWIERIVTTTPHGKYLDDDIEEYTDPIGPTPNTLRREIQNLFDNPFEEGTLAPDVQAIMMANEMERNKVMRIKELKAEGHSTEEAKIIFQQEIDLVISDALGVEAGSLAVTMGSEFDEGEDSDIDRES